MSLTNYDKVGVFHTVFDHPIRQPVNIDNSILANNPALVDLRVKLVVEEFTELKTALANIDLVEVVDALGDMMYVIYGAGLAFGIDLRTNLSIKPDTKSIDFKDTKTSSDYIDAIHKYVDMFTLSCKCCDIKNVSTSMSSMLSSIYKYGAALGVDLDYAFDLIHNSNMTKACNTEVEAQESVAQYIKDIKYSDPRYKAKGNFFIVYDHATGKILKNKNYSAVNLKYLLAK